MGWVWVIIVRDSSHDKLAILRIEGILWVGSIILKLIIAPTVVVALFCIPFLRDRRTRLKACLPVDRIYWLLWRQWM